ncbi:hypothetical protein E4U35_002834, partial [Claviceps purpurea]
MSSTSSYQSPANGLNIPNDQEGRSPLLGPPCLHSAPWPFSCDSHTSQTLLREPAGPKDVSSGSRQPRTVEHLAWRASNSQRNRQQRRTYLRGANDSGEASLSGGEPTTPKGVNYSEGRIFGEVNTSGGASHVEDLGVQCLQAE